MKGFSDLKGKIIGLAAKVKPFLSTHKGQAVINAAKCTALVLSGVVLLSLLPVSAQFSATDETGILRTDIYAHEQPSKTSEPTFFAKQGTQVIVDDKLNDGWYLVNANGMRGYVSGIYVKTKDSSIPVSGVAGEGTVAEVSCLNAGTVGAEVVALQKKLKQLGYYGGEIMGSYNAAVTAAVRVFQNKNEIKATGTADENTLAVIYGESPISAFADSKEARSLFCGSCGNEVALLQKALHALGFFDYSATGCYGKCTEAAVRQLQLVLGIKETGIADSNTQSELYKMTGLQLAVSANDALKTTEVKHKGSPEIEYEALSSGASGQNVTKLQNSLIKLGYLSSRATGRYLSQTVSAVKAFQQKNGLDATGKADSATQRLIYALSADKMPVITPSPTPAPTPDMKELNKGAQGTQVVLMQQRLKALGYFGGTTTGEYGDVTCSAVKSFQGVNGIKATGVADSATLTALYSASAKKKPEPQRTPIPDSKPDLSIAAGTKNENGVELLNWFEGGSKLFAKGVTAKVTDVDTGKSFYVKRFGGTNHADVEPIDTENTKIMKEIVGTWSWNRRAIVVEIGGRKIAASMTGMPHDINWGVGNGFNYTEDGVTKEGHFCIHFKGSKLHVRDEMDPQHQNAVAKAFKYGK